MWCLDKTDTKNAIQGDLKQFPVELLNFNEHDCKTQRLAPTNRIARSKVKINFFQKSQRIKGEKGGFVFVLEIRCVAHLPVLMVCVSLLAYNYCP